MKDTQMRRLEEIGFQALQRGEITPQEFYDRFVCRAIRSAEARIEALEAKAKEAEALATSEAKAEDKRVHFKGTTEEFRNWLKQQYAKAEEQS